MKKFSKIKTHFDIEAPSDLKISLTRIEAKERFNKLAVRIKIAQSELNAYRDEFFSIISPVRIGQEFTHEKGGIYKLVNYKVIGSSTIWLFAYKRRIDGTYNTENDVCHKLDVNGVIEVL